ncbi:cytochrome B [Caenimonas koreensis DSM 17982]|uniref:Cytochrome B n=1 Tax=Caenimonas koreensis DSM 17982 TaxID=1121255 RepID=A0A844BBQ2_9BURK|nr:cytochrome B [Caenimonas koreensis DSM 17982]
MTAGKHRASRPATISAVNDQHTRPIRIWDLPTRIFHWALAGSVAALVVTGHLGGEWMPWHARLGYLVASLLAFRVVWGFVGGHWSRFSTFTVKPSKVVAYLRGEPFNGHGHSPAGSVSVVVILCVLALQVGSGLYSDDTADFVGPLNRFVSNATAKVLTTYHKDFGQWLVVALVAIHVAAVAFYKWRQGLSLTAAMVGGDKVAAGGGGPGSRDDVTTRLLALAIFGVIAAVVVALVGTSG